jgi:disulfide bond formation protein DsbB
MAVAPSATLETIRRLLLGLLVFGMAGTTTELVLMNHYEDWKQFIPFVGMGISLLTLLWFAFSRSPGATRSFRLCMFLLMVIGATGTILHYRANMEFQLEMDSTLSGIALMLKVLHAKAPPALAPGNMALLGLLGLISTLGVTRRIAINRLHSESDHTRSV